VAAAPFGIQNTAHPAPSIWLIAAKVDFTTGASPYNLVLVTLMVTANLISCCKPVGNTVSVFRNTSTSGSITTSSLAAKVDFATGTSHCIAIGDIDGDGKPDLAVQTIPATLFQL